MSFARTQMNIRSLILNKISQAQEDKTHMISLVCGI